MKQTESTWRKRSKKKHVTIKGETEIWIAECNRHFKKEEAYTRNWKFWKKILLKKKLQKVGKIANQIKTNIGNRGIWETNRKIKQLKEYKTRKMETKLDRKQNG